MSFEALDEILRSAYADARRAAEQLERIPAEAQAADVRHALIKLHAAMRGLDAALEKTR